MVNCILDRHHWQACLNIWSSTNKSCNICVLDFQLSVQLRLLEEHLKQEKMDPALIPEAAIRQREDAFKKVTADCIEIDRIGKQFLNDINEVRQPLFIHPFIHSGYFYSASSSPLLLRGTHDYSNDTCRSFHVVVLLATMSEELVQGPYVAARVGFEPATPRTQPINEPPRLALHLVKMIKIRCTAALPHKSYLNYPFLVHLSFEN